MQAHGLEIFGAMLDEQQRPSRVTNERPINETNRKWMGVAAVGGALAGGVLWRAHPVLGFLGGWAVGRNVTGAALREIPVTEAAVNLGANVVATAGSLALPSHPAIGYIAGSVTSSFVMGAEVLDSRLSRSSSSSSSSRRLADGRSDDVLGAGAGSGEVSLDDVRSGKVTMLPGSLGDGVKFVQDGVNNGLGKSACPVNGIYDDLTVSAVREFQRANVIKVDGKVGKETMAAIDRTFVGPPPRVSFVPATVAVVPRPQQQPPQQPLVTRTDAGGMQIAGQPAWKVALAGVAAVAAGGATYYFATR